MTAPVQYVAGKYKGQRPGFREEMAEAVHTLNGLLAEASDYGIIQLKAAEAMTVAKDRPHVVVQISMTVIAENVVW